MREKGKVGEKSIPVQSPSEWSPQQRQANKTKSRYSVVGDRHGLPEGEANVISDVTISRSILLLQ